MYLVFTFNCFDLVFFFFFSSKFLCLLLRLRKIPKTSVQDVRYAIRRARMFWEFYEVSEYGSTIHV